MKLHFLLLGAIILSASSLLFAFEQMESIYGADSRHPIAEGDKSLQEIAKSVAAQVSDRNLVFKDDHISKYSVGNVGDIYNLCNEENFRSDPALSDCTGTLIGNDLILTAKHCLREISDCSSKKWIFNYENRSIKYESGEIEFNNNDIYSCKEIVQGRGNQNLDYVFVRLDRKVSNTRPLLLNTIKKVPVSKNLKIVGFPLGAPKMYVDDFKVLKESEISYVLNSDTFSGNSGSPVIDATTKLVVGMIIAGEKDLKYDVFQSCNHYKKCLDNKCTGETALKSTSIKRSFLF